MYRFLKLSILLPLLCAGQLFAEEEVLDGVAAVVNGEVITISQLREVVLPRQRALQNTYKGEDLVNKIKEARVGALNDLIDRQLILQEFKKRQATIPDFHIDERIQTIIREEFGGDRSAFIRTLQAQGYTLDRFKEVEREKVIVQAMRQYNVRPNLVIPPRKIEEYYAKNRSKYATPEQVKLRMISISQNGEEGDSKKMMEEIRSKIMAGGDFEKMAQIYSEDSSKDAGGDWGWIDRNTLNEELTKTAFALKAGEVSHVLTVGDKYYLLYVEAKKHDSVKPLKEMRGEIEKELLQAERQQLQQKWVESLRKKAYIRTF